MGVTVEEPNQHANYCNRLLALAFGGIFLTSTLYWSSRLRMNDWKYIPFKKMNKKLLHNKEKECAFS